MSYPDYPENKIYILKYEKRNGVNVTVPIHLDDKFKMIMVDGYTLSPPEPKLYTVDIPGGNGSIDLTEALNGDVVYGNRKQEFTFYIVDLSDEKEFERIKMEVSNLLHGRSYDYVMTMDPGYTYHGRFSVSGYTHESYANGLVGIIKLSIDADPYKLSEIVEYYDAIDGRLITIKNGRMRTQPVFGVKTENPPSGEGYMTKVIFKGVEYKFIANGNIVDDIVLDPGYNDIYIKSPGHLTSSLKWSNLQSVTWQSFGNQRLYEWYRNGVSYNDDPARASIRIKIERGDL